MARRAKTSRFRPGMRVRFRWHDRNATAMHGGDGRTATLMHKNASYAEWHVRLDVPHGGKVDTFWDERNMEPESSNKGLA